MLTARKLATAIELAFGKAGKELIDPLDCPWAVTLKRNLQIFLNTEIGKNPSALLAVSCG